MHACVRACVCLLVHCARALCTSVCARACICARACVYMRVLVHLCAFACSGTRAACYVRMRVRVCVNVCVRARACARARVPACVRVHVRPSSPAGAWSVCLRRAGYACMSWLFGCAVCFIRRTICIRGQSAAGLGAVAARTEASKPTNCAFCCCDPSAGTHPCARDELRNDANVALYNVALLRLRLLVARSLAACAARSLLAPHARCWRRATSALAASAARSLLVPLAAGAARCDPFVARSTRTERPTNHQPRNMPMQTNNDEPTNV